MNNILKTKHTDWPWPFSLIPRKWNSVHWGAPKMIKGNQKRMRHDKTTINMAPAPIGEPGSWQFSYYPKAPWYMKPFSWYIACTNKKGRHFRIGTRWDDVDNYATLFSVATRKFPLENDGERDTST